MAQWGNAALTFPRLLKWTLLTYSRAVLTWRRYLCATLALFLKDASWPSAPLVHGHTATFLFHLLVLLHSICKARGLKSRRSPNRRSPPQNIFGCANHNYMDINRYPVSETCVTRLNVRTAPARVLHTWIHEGVKNAKIGWLAEEFGWMMMVEVGGWWASRNSKHSHDASHFFSGESGRYRFSWEALDWQTVIKSRFFFIFFFLALFWHTFLLLKLFALWSQLSLEFLLKAQSFRTLLQFTLIMSWNHCALINPARTRYTSIQRKFDSAPEKIVTLSSFNKLESVCGTLRCLTADEEA